MLTESGKALVDTLVRLTKEDKVEWIDRTSPVINNHYVGEINMVTFATEWLQDDRPKLHVQSSWNQSVIDGYEIRELIEEIRKKQGLTLEPDPGLSNRDVVENLALALRERHIKNVLEVINS